MNIVILMLILDFRVPLLSGFFTSRFFNKVIMRHIS